MYMIGVQLVIFEDGTVSWPTNGGFKGSASVNILLPVQKSTEFQKQSLQVSKHLNKILPSSEVLLKPVECFENPGVCLPGPLNGEKCSFRGDAIQ